jgi:uncharacterized protein YjbI with pentapeptide repeats
VSAIWISFLVFSLYLLIAATTVTQRQLLLAEPVKLPVLNIDLPQWGFFFLAPVLFVILHVYVLLQVLLLGRTTAAYNTAVSRVDLSPEENASLRQRLANTLFAQIFAGSPREREGFVGSLLRAIVWITLVIAPILILLAFQFSSLPYHSHIATWTHRLLILFELAAFFLIWPLALDAQKDFQWPQFGADLRRLLLLPIRLLGPKRQEKWPWLRLQVIPISACLLFILASLSLATFPGEPHVNLLTGQPLLSVQCERWIFNKFESADLRIDRLIVPGIDVVDDEKLAKITRATDEKQQKAYEGERTQNFRGRNLQCGSFNNADFRRADFSGANLAGATLDSAELDGATLDDAQLNDASLALTKLLGASLLRANLQNSQLTIADLSRALAKEAQLEGADLISATLFETDFSNSLFYAADLSYARLQGASLVDASLQRADLTSANLQAAILTRAQLHGATFTDAELEGVYFFETQLQGAVFDGSKLEIANFQSAFLWRASTAQCTNAQVKSPQLAGVIDVTRDSKDYTIKPVEANTKSIQEFIQRIVSETPATKQKRLHELLDARLSTKIAPDVQVESDASWRVCAFIARGLLPKIGSIRC